ncbi:unnamed protein product [Tetraodon nigroviridis]|uniref:(spotted green pufferfish) hypothetical protein n=1 Tax=Tetraodon nigroviridis TaxID=99883 RepID=Q4RE28_TETNG|nr:unnamed protein product [Tetraodon nigroviridis]
MITGSSHIIKNITSSGEPNTLYRSFLIFFSRLLKTSESV